MAEPEPETVMTKGPNSRIDQIKKKIATKMWNDYVQYTKRR